MTRFYAQFGDITVLKTDRRTYTAGIDERPMGVLIKVGWRRWLLTDKEASEALLDGEVPPEVFARSTVLRCGTSKAIARLVLFVNEKRERGEDEEGEA